MTRDDAKLILGIYRPGTADAEDPFFAQALAMAAADPELANWFAGELDFDGIVAGSLKDRIVPPEEFRVALPPPAPRLRQIGWEKVAALTAAAAAVTFLATWLWLAPPARRDMIADFRQEMTAFVSIDPSLALDSGDREEIHAWLRKSAALEDVSFPPGTAGLKPVGCRVLEFRGYPVALVCFVRDDKELVHLLVINRDAFPAGKIGGEPVFTPRGGWMTATWMEGGKVRMLVTKGGRASLERYF